MTSRILIIVAVPGNCGRTKRFSQKAAKGAEERGLHLRVAEKLANDPGSLDVARRNLERWLERNPHQALLEWKDMLDSLSLEELLDPDSSVRSFPEPPRQRDPWTPPDADLPPEYLSATAALFEHGMADPRGCEYREIELVVGDVRWRSGEVVKTCGWVLSKEGEQRFAVAWNGLVYPVLAVGEPGDLRADVLAAIRDSQGRVWLTWNAYPERETVVADTRFAIQGCLLLRLGEVELAREVWSDIEASKRARFEGLGDGGDEEVDPAKLPDTDPYLDWASEWAWGLLERAVVAHMHGDDRMALASARFLAAVSPMIEAEAQRRGFPVREYYGSPSLRSGYLQFLGPLPALLADQERRLQRGEPFWRFPEAPVLRDARSRMFGDGDSPWGTLAWMLDDYYFRRTRPVASPLLILPEFRTMVAKELVNSTVEGEAVYQESGVVQIESPSGRSWGYGGRRRVDVEPGATAPVRRCDDVVSQVASISGFPSFSFFWPEERRDEIIAVMVDLLVNSKRRGAAKITMVAKNRRNSCHPVG